MKTIRRPTTRASAALALLILASLVCVSAAIWRSAAAAEGPAKSPPASAKPKPDAGEKAIRASADEFAKAFNAGDAKALGDLWADDAEYTDESGKTLQGRDAIAKEYAALFQEQPGATIDLAIESIRFPAPDVAIEKGIAKVKSPAARGESASRYTVIHVKRDGRWTMSVGRDDPYLPTSNEDYLKDLGWLIGEWMPDGQENGPRIKCEWMAQKNFIRVTYTTVSEDKTALTSVQVIGWNPKLRAIVSWHFDASGGFGDDLWSLDGAKWVLEASGIGRDGSESSAVNVLTPLDANSFSWQSLRRTLNGDPLPDTALVKMVRVPAAKARPTPKP